MKKHLWFSLIPIIFIGLFLMHMDSKKALGSNTDKWNISGEGIYNSKDMARIDSSYNFRLFNGNIVMGDSAVAPSTTIPTSYTQVGTQGGYYGLKVPFVNGSNASTFLGEVIIVSTNPGVGTTASVQSTTTVMGICDGVYASSATGWITIEGYALTATTGAVKPGDLLTTSTFSAAVGFAGSTIPTSGVLGLANGAVFGVSLSSVGLQNAGTFGVTTNGLALTLLRRG